MATVIVCHPAPYVESWPDHWEEAEDMMRSLLHFVDPQCVTWCGITAEEVAP